MRLHTYDDLLQVRWGLVTDDPTDFLHGRYGTDTIEPLRELIEDYNIVVALDQASIKTGMCIMDFDTREVLAALELINVGFPTKDLYFQAVYDFLKNNISDLTVKYFFYEIPVEHSKNVQASIVLEAMRQFIRDFSKVMPELVSANVVEVPSTTWKSLFLKDKRYAGKRKKRDLVKESTREEACLRVPELTQYLYSTNEPPDSCDAIGIAYGALEEIYGGENNDLRQPNKTMRINNCSYQKRIVPLAGNNIAKYISTTFPVKANNGRVELLRFNTTMSVDENCKRYCSCNAGMLGVMPVYDPKTSQEIKWEIGQELKPGEIYFVFCWR